MSGPSGSGKTSVLMALLGEMHFLPTQLKSWYGLPREKGIGYVAQESWIQNDTIRGNILFGATHDEERYKAGMCLFSFGITSFNVCYLSQFSTSVLSNVIWNFLRLET